jgi:hypothetical protein
MTTIRTTLTHAALGGLLFAGGCAQLRAASATPAPMEGRLSGTLQRVETEVLAQRFGVADRLLVDFAEGHVNTPEAVETAFWRALFMLDAANRTATAGDALALLDGYLGAPVMVAHRGAATSLRRIAVVLDRPAPPAATASAPAAAPSGRTEPKPDARTDDRSRDAEVQRLREELAKANAELERIKKRVAQPNP